MDRNGISHQEAPLAEDTCSQHDGPNQSRFVFSQDWFHVYIREDWARLTAHLRDIKLRILEIGAFEGASTTWMLDNLMGHPESLLVVVDTFEGGMEHRSTCSNPKYNLKTLYERFRANVNSCEHVNKLEVIRMRSEDALLELRRKGTSFDFIYIDASHVAMDVLTDAVLSWPMLAVNGTLVFDDWRWRGFLEDCYNPRIAIQSFILCGASNIETTETEYQMWIKKVRNKIPATANKDDPEVRYWDNKAGLQWVTGESHEDNLPWKPKSTADTGDV